jgi:hypothetical protein
MATALAYQHFGLKSPQTIAQQLDALDD